MPFPAMSLSMELTKVFYSPKAVAEMLGVSPRTILYRIHKHQVQAIKLSGTYRIPIGEVARLTGASLPARSLPPIVYHSPEDIKEEIRGYEQTSGMTTEDFVKEYLDDPDAEQWMRYHHRWAGLSGALEPKR